MRVGTRAELVILVRAVVGVVVLEPREPAVQRAGNVPGSADLLSVLSPGDERCELVDPGEADRVPPRHACAISYGRT